MTKTESGQRLFAVIESFRDRIAKAGKVPEEAIEKVEKILGVRLPEDYRLFLRQYGAIRIEGVSIYGVSSPVDQEPSLVWALNGLWQVSPDIPKNLVPVQHLADSRSMICIECQSAQSADSNGLLVSWSLEPTKARTPIPLRLDFATYVSQFLMGIKHRETSLRVMQEHVRDFERDYLAVGKLPRNYVWRPYRFCSQDVVLGLAVVRHSIDNNCLEVDVCMTSDVAEFEEGIGTKVTTSFLLSEAYKCGGSMEIRFTENVEGGRVPDSICRLAQKYGMQLGHIRERRIAPSEAKRLFLAISVFSQPLTESIESLSREGRLSTERACYALHHGLWTRAQIENIILGSPWPESIFGGDSWPEQRHLYLNDLRHASVAVMGGVLDRRLARRDRSTGNEVLDLEDDVRPLDISFDPEYCAKVYSCVEDIVVPWIKGNDPRVIEPGKELVVLLRVYEVEDLARYLDADIVVAQGFSKDTQRTDQASSVFILVPRDFDELPQKSQDRLLSYAEKHDVGIMVCPETVVALETDSARRLASSRIMRE